MKPSRRLPTLSVAIVTGVLVLWGAIGHVARAADVSYPAAALADRLAAEGRGEDQTTNPDYHRRSAPLVAAYFESGQKDEGVLHDPYRLGWNGTRGEVVPVYYRNRYGARIAAHLWRPTLPWRDPITGSVTDGPFPAVVVIPGFGSADITYEGLIEQLAESGYVVMSFDPQGQGDSDTAPSPTTTYCDPNGSWRQPQELGLREHGRCAGEDPADVNDPGTPTSHPVYRLLGPLNNTPVGLAVIPPELLDVRRELLTDPARAVDQFAAGYETFRTRFVFGAFDAVAWLRSANDPWRSLIDLNHVGVAGHSAGSDGALVAGNGDPKHRFAAAVAWDTYGRPPATVRPTVPTMIQQSEQENFAGPWIPKPTTDFFISHAISAQFRTVGVPQFEAALRGSTHQEWTYVPYALFNPVAPLTNSSSLGQEVAAYYTIAWFDRWLKGASDPVQALDADRRLRARTFDGSADRSSIGQGRYDPLLRRNVSYHIAGLRVHDLLSRIFLSSYGFDGHTCLDVQQGC